MAEAILAAKCMEKAGRLKKAIKTGEPTTAAKDREEPAPAVEDPGVREKWRN